MVNKNFVEELRWRGMLHNITPGAEELLNKEQCTAYIGIDPTADSLHIGHLVGIIVMKHFQNAGHKPIIVVGGATGMIGDPSGKSEERNLLDENALRHNQECLKKQIARFIDFSENKALLVNNYDWTKDYSYLYFIRDIGKHITINYMLAKESVKQRIEGQNGISYTEFSYMLLQAYDFFHLYDNYSCKFQLGGSDQWGNITAGTELIRRKLSAEAFGITFPLITKSDGKKFGKTEKGNIWLDEQKTSPYEFYQFLLNISDADAEKFVKIFSFKDKEQIEQLIAEHITEPHKRILQKALAEELTEIVHGKTNLQKAIDASCILFGNSTKEQLLNLDEKTIIQIFNDVPNFEITENEMKEGVNVVDLLTEKTKVFASKGECRRMISEKGLYLNQENVLDAQLKINSEDLIFNKFLIIRKGKKNYSLIKIL